MSFLAESAPLIRGGDWIVCSSGRLVVYVGSTDLGNVVAMSDKRSCKIWGEVVQPEEILIVIPACALLGRIKIT